MKTILWLVSFVAVVGAVGAFYLLPHDKNVAKESPDTQAALVVTAAAGATTTTKKEESKPIPVPTPTPKPVTQSFTSVKQLLPKKNSEPRTTPITHVVVHFISNVSAKPSEPFNFQDIKGIFLNTGLSSHYFIERDGTVYQLTEENRVAYHAGKGELPKFPDYTNKLNLYSIGIEIAAIGTKQEMAEFITGNEYDKLPKSFIGYTDAQYAALNKLLNEIYTRYPSFRKDRDHVIGHDEYAPDRKHDPGSLFDWSRIGF